MYESGYVEWDVDMVFEEPEAEPCLPSALAQQPHSCHPPSSGQQASSALANCGAGVMLPHALPVVHGTVEEAEAGLPTRAAAPASHRQQSLPPYLSR
jgi:hypothetical protein